MTFAAEILQVRCCFCCIFLFDLKRSTNLKVIHAFFSDSVNYLKTKYFQVYTALNLVVQRRLVKAAGLQFYSKSQCFNTWNSFLCFLLLWKEITALVKIIGHGVRKRLSSLNSHTEVSKWNISDVLTLELLLAEMQNVKVQLYLCTW